MKRYILITIVVAILLLLAFLMIYFIHNDSSSNPNTYEGMEKLFNDTTTNLNQVGGILCNNFGPEWFQAMLQRGEVSLQDTSVCAHVNRKTCTAYSYLRKDLIPMLFMFPGVESSVPCGIILDTRKVWPLITLMAIVDGDTNNRSCCTNDSGGPILTRNPWEGNPGDFCIYNSMKNQVEQEKLHKKYIDHNYAVYIPVKDQGVTGGTCNRSCKGDRTCMYNNSGGNINQWLMNASPECVDGKYSDCFVFEEIDASNVPKTIRDQVQPEPDGWLVQSISPKCETCKKPFLCVFKDAPSNVEGFDSSSQDKYRAVEEPDRFATYIGDDGLGMQTAVTHDMQIGNIAIKQCRFERDDWNKWIDVLKQYYRDIMGILRSDNSMVDNFNYQLANPDSPSYFENEVNLYIDPDTNSSEYKKQNKIWQDSIIGFYFTESTCEEQLKPLEGVTSTFYDTTVTGTVDRCNGFFNMDTDTRRDWEKNRYDMSRKLVHQVADMFNKNQKRKVPVYKCTADSNAFPNYKSFVTAFAGDVKLSSIFQPDNDYKA